MDKIPVLWNNTQIGQLILEREKLYTWFQVRCHLPQSGLWCAWVIGDAGELRLGILEPEGECFAIRRRYSDRLTAPIGTVLNGEIRPAFCDEGKWEPVAEPYRQIREPWLRQQLQKTQGALMRVETETMFIAVPYDRKCSFPMVPLFCFAEIRTIRKRNYAVFAFDETHRPVFAGHR